ncbi:neutral zinc metallopeptidase [Sphingomonas sp. Root241]|uniref:KPN_02809 family neutral zinc metallopeptidase n=1 Tax=Sphingomonas sp. Root241 TaxID=1736501 RepID=UPI0006F5B903|nr:neutral zinc metallopeptidase [Sphingomonas sp. Root241]KRC80076.1 zinc metalloprotease [Sphingomonas sp. Root241]
MRLDDLDPTENARDFGSGGGGGGGGFGLLGLLPLLLGRGMGCGGIALIGIVALIFFGMGGGGLLNGGGGGTQTRQGQTQGAPKACDTQDELFACRVMTSTEQVWGEVFAEHGQRYRPATINFFQNSVQSACGQASSAVGPFYCPGDQGVFLDTGFFEELDKRFGAKGDFARAYVVGHEVGHHIQNLEGTSAKVSQAQGRASRTEGNRLSVLLELQADCYAGVWAKRSGRLEAGDIEEGMAAASAIGDDTLQRQGQGEVVPDSFTHGTSSQRMEWLKRGLESGDPAKCDTFAAAG